MDTHVTEHRLLRALLDTAADLAELRDTEAVLAAIVRRTRALVGSDMAYISLNDHEQGFTYIRRSEGVATEAYRTIRMPIGTGVLGKVAEGESPFQTSDYTEDITLTHIEDIDATVRGEGVHAIMGAPLIVDGVCLGALMVAERHARAFTPLEVGIVESLSKHAAVALKNASRYGQAVSAARRADADLDEERRQLRALTRLAELASRQCEALISDPSPQAVLNRAKDFLQAEVRFVPGGSTEARELVRASRTEASAPAKPLGSGQVAAFAPRVARLDGPGSSRTAIALPDGAAVKNWAVVDAHVDEHDLVALERTAQHIVLARRLREADGASAASNAERILQDLLSKDARSSAAQSWLHHELQLTADTDLTACAVDVPDDDSMARLPRQLAEIVGVRLAGRHKGRWVVLSVSPDAPRRIQALLERVCTGRWRLAFLPHGPHLSAPLEAAQALGEAMALAELMPGNAVVDGSRVGTLGTAVASSSEAALRPLAPLLSLPEPRRSALLATAETFLDTHTNITKTAARLFLHRNTVKQRLGQLGELLGTEWTQSPQCLDIQLGHV